MAGFYPDVPGRRLAWDRDSTVAKSIRDSDSYIRTLDAAAMTEMNDEDASRYRIDNGETTNTGANYYLALLFPAARDLVGYYLNGRIRDNDHPGQLYGPLEYSNDTTTGLDGSWTEITALAVADAGSSPVAVSPRYRTEIQTLAVTCTAIRWSSRMHDNGEVGVAAYHLYAEEYSSALRLWHPTLDEEIGGAYFDWGDVAQGETYDRQFRVHNAVPSRDAGGITVGTDVLSDGAVPIGAQLTYSDGGAFATSINIGDVASGAESGLITLRYTVAAGADTGPWAWRTVAEPATLT